MAIVSTSASSADAFSILREVDIATVVTQTASEYSWLTPLGDLITLRGVTLAYSGSTLTSGNIHNIEIDIGNNGSVDMSVSSAGLPSITALTSGNTNVFWQEVLNGSDTVNLANALGTSSHYWTGDGAYTTAATSTGATDIFYLSDGGMHVTGDYYGVNNGQSVTGASDFFYLRYLQSTTSSILRIAGDITIGNGSVTGGDDVFIDQSAPGFTTGSLVVTGDLVSSQSLTTATVVGGADYMRIGQWGGSALIGDVNTVYRDQTAITGGDDRMIAGPGNSVLTGDVETFITGSGGTLVGGDDTMIGDTGNDLIYGEFRIDNSAGAAAVSGGNDRVHAGGGNDAVYGQTGDDILFGGAGADTIEGGDGNDLIGGGHTFDMISLNEERRDQGQFAAVYGADMMPTDRLTLEFLFRSLVHESEWSGAFYTFVSYAAPSNNNEILILGDINGTIRIEVAGRAYLTTFATENLLTGAHHRLSLTHDSTNNTLRFYVDGNEVYAANGLMDAVDPGGILILGQEQDAFGGRFDPNQAGQGQIGDIRLFDTIRGQSAIRQNMGEELDPSTSGLVANWQADAATGSIVNTVDPTRPMLLMGGASIVDGGTDGDDSLSGGDGNDTIHGHGGDDALLGGDGLDRLYGGDGNDSLVGGGDFDLIYGNGGNDTLLGGDGSDFLVGGDGNDSIEAGAGAFGLLDGGDGDDTLVAGPDSQELRGGAGHDVLYLSATGQDSATGGAGDDTIYGSAATFRQSAVGGDGNDLMVALAEDSGFFGGAGNDTMDASAATGQAFFDAGDDSDTFIGSAFGDTVQGGAGDDLLEGFGGDDSIASFGGNNTISGGDGNDFLSAGDGADSLIGGAGNDDLYGGSGDDTLLGGNNDDFLSGGTGLDALVGGGGNDWFFGEADGDTLSGGNGRDLADYSDFEAADLTIDLSANMGPGGDVLLSIEDVWTGDGNDSVTGDSGSNRLEGGAGRDTLHGGDGGVRDVLLGGAASDNLNGGLGGDIVNGGGSNDTVIGGGGDDTLLGGGGNDMISGGSGADLFVFQEGSWGDDTLANWDAGADRIRVVSAFTAADATLSQQGADVLFTLTPTGDTILFQNTLLADVDLAGDFVFV